jgi:hypothetical protein
LLASVKEAIALGENFTPRSAEQEKFIDLARHRNFAHIKGRVSQAFLEQFPEAMESGFTA